MATNRQRDKGALHRAAARMVARKLRSLGHQPILRACGRGPRLDVEVGGLKLFVRVARLVKSREMLAGNGKTYRYNWFSWNLHRHGKLIAPPDFWVLGAPSARLWFVAPGEAFKDKHAVAISWPENRGMRTLGRWRDAWDLIPTVKMANRA